MQTGETIRSVRAEFDCRGCLFAMARELRGALLLAFKAVGELAVEVER